MTYSCGKICMVEHQLNFYSQIFLKLENLQPSGSFKSRGIGNFIRSTFTNQGSSAGDEDSSKSIHFYSSSGGNAGLACVHAAVALGSPATIVIPESTSEYTKRKMQTAGATDVIQYGRTWIDADTHLRDVILSEARARGEQAIYVPPFDAPGIWEGHATMVDEIVEQFQELESISPQLVSEHPRSIDAVVCSVGGGGLLSGVMQGLESAKLGDTQILAMETEGADSLSHALKNGRLTALPGITSIATTLGARTVCPKAYEYGQKENVKSVVLTDREAINACREFTHDERIMVEPACGVALAVCYDGKLKELLSQLRKDSNVVIIVCGGSNITLDLFQSWNDKFD